MRLGLVLLVSIAGACGGDDQPTQGELGGHCYPNGTCNVTLACAGGICVAGGQDAGTDSSTDAIFDAPADSPQDGWLDAAPDAYCVASQPAQAPDGHHNPGTGCMSAAACHNQALGLGTGAPAYSYAGTLYQSDRTTPFAGAAVVLRLGTAEKKVVVATNGNFWLVPGVAGLDPPTNTNTATALASACPDTVTMVGALTQGGGDCNKSGCHTPGVGLGAIHLP